MLSAYLVIAHGSREQNSNEDFFSFLERFRAALPGHLIEGAFLECAPPSIPDALEKCASRGAGEICVIPFMLFSGRHVKEDIPRFIQEAKSRHPEIDFHYASPLADHPAMIGLLADKIETFKPLKGKL